MKNLYILLTVFAFFTSNAQLSNKHWLPPLHSRDATAISDQYIYMSTNETVPFQVTATDGNGVPYAGSPFTISAASPASFTVGTGQPTKMFLNLSDVNTVVSGKGVMLQGTKDFYVSFRMRHMAHAETIISKGKPGIGTNFRLGCTINEIVDNRKNFVSSVMATENNTTVTLSNYNTGVVFSSGTGNITDDTQTYTLNAGQCIVFSGYSNVTANLDGIIGGLITSDKPVAVNTGNVLGGNTNTQGDITLDQIVSASQIGTDYIFIEGNGISTMENPLIVAHENNTDIFVNGSTAPIITLNAGQYYLVPNSFYQGTINSNIYIRASKPVFAYQLLGGGSSAATSGLNFIPPLSCFFQNSVNIPNVNQIGSNTYTSDLMMLTYSNATISINGVAVPTSQAQTVLGNTDWVSYRIANQSGNLAITSTGPLAVGVFGFQGTAAGFAGYYSGFGSTPLPTDVEVCSSSTTNLFDAINGNPDPGGTWAVPTGGAPLVGNIFNPAINIAGEYIYSFTKTCNTSPTPISVSVFVTIQQANNAGTSIPKNTCKNELPFDLFLSVPGATTGGTWSLNGVNRPNSTFNPAPNNDLSGTYTYTIPASGVCPAISSNVVVTNYDVPTLVPITDLKACDDALDGNDTNGQTTFTLTQKTTEILNSQANVAVTYHLLQSEAVSGTNAITSYTGPNRIIYARLFNTITNCFNTTSFNVVVTPLPVLKPVIEPLKQCDNDTDSITDFNLTEANVILSNQSNLTFKYFLTQTDAQNNTGQIINDTAYNSPDNRFVWARIENTDGCFRTAQVNLLVSATQIPATFQKIVLEECDDYIDLNDPDTDGIDYFDFTGPTNSFASATSTILAPFSNSSNLTVTYYTTEAQALAETNPIDTTDPDGFRNTVPNLQNIWVRIDSNTNNDCVGLGQYLDLKVNPLPNFDIIDYKVLCVQPSSGAGNFPINATPTVPGNYTYTWTPTNPNTTGGQQNAIFNADASGIYKVVVTNTATLCSREDQMEIFVSSAPDSVTLELVSEIFSSGLATIQAEVIGGFGSYEFSLNLVDWQTSPVFTNLANGNYTVYARDVNGCPGVIQSNTVTTISYPNYFTPNGDTYNDTWNISGLTPEFEAKIFIFDRYGKLLKQINPYANGWDGTYNEQEMPSTDYWFKIEYKEDGIQKEFKAHFSLKR
ncbi:T9SS type B sorting domain-containing protein [Flavobacterium sp.]|jgi:gliding motility-associated-like protein|uniref:T9SS type B sorting domain-containing protein n=1 Tax=Flavobacterium sp. TaxID=239 RepID=UPI0037C05AEA